MKKSHKLPARGSYKEAKTIQAKKKDRSFFDYSDAEKREIIEHAVEAGNEMQRETMRQAEKIRKAVEIIHNGMKLNSSGTLPKKVSDAIDFLSDQNRCTNCGFKLIQIGPHEWKCSCMPKNVRLSIG